MEPPGGTHTTTDSLPLVNAFGDNRFHVEIPRTLIVLRNKRHTYTNRLQGLPKQLAIP